MPFDPISNEHNREIRVEDAECFMDDNGEGQTHYFNNPRYDYRITEAPDLSSHHVIR